MNPPKPLKYIVCSVGISSGWVVITMRRLEGVDSARLMHDCAIYSGPWKPDSRSSSVVEREVISTESGGMVWNGGEDIRARRCSLSLLQSRRTLTGPGRCRRKPQLYSLYRSFNSIFACVGYYLLYGFSDIENIPGLIWEVKKAVT